MIEDTSWAYLAGLIDGEGALAIYNTQPRIVIAMRDPEAVDWVMEVFGGRYRRNECLELGTLRTRYTWGVYSRSKVRELLEGSLPYLTVKHKRAKEVLDDIASRRPQR